MMLVGVMVAMLEHEPFLRKWGGKVCLLEVSSLGVSHWDARTGPECVNVLKNSRLFFAMHKAAWLLFQPIRLAC